MQNNQRFDNHYQMLGTNKEAIKYIDTQIDEVLHKKAAIIERYAQVSVKESGTIINSGEISSDRKGACDRLRDEIDKEILSYDEELKQLQIRRAALWDAHADFQKNILAQEKSRNSNLDNVYKQHSALLEKVYLRHIDDTEAVALKSIDAGTLSFKDLMMAPIQFLTQVFGGGISTLLPGVSIVHTHIERSARKNVEMAEQDINNGAPEKVKTNSHPLDEAEDNEEVKQTAVSFNL